MSRDDKKNTPMDSSAKEQKTGTPATNQQRVCWAIKTLNEEVWALFPETPVEYSDYNGRNTALAVTFDLSALSHDDADLLTGLLSLLIDPALTSETRIAHVVANHTDKAVRVSMRADVRTQDSREPFGLADAFDVLAGNEDDGDTDGGDASDADDTTIDGGGA